MYCIEGTAPTSWSVCDSRTQPLGPDCGVCCQCQCCVEMIVAYCTAAPRIERFFSILMVTPVREMMWKCRSSFLCKGKCLQATVVQWRMLDLEIGDEFPW
jgi:hypothetical protein